MNPLAPLIQENNRLARRITRLLSLFLVGFYLSLILFNDDLRTNPTLPFILFSLVVLSAPLAWRWEQEGGLLTMALALVFGLYIMINALVQYQFPVVTAVIGAALLAVPFFLVGWLFYTLGRNPIINQSNSSE
jgi:hypothetical protein